MRSNKNAAVFLDRDGTIIEDRGHLRDPSDVVFFSETFEALRKLQEHFHLFIVTNQRGIAEGRITRRDVDRINRCIGTALFDRGIKIENVYTCPHRRSDNCRCIKPKPYFLKRAASRYHLDLSKSFAVGDHPHDIQLARNADASGIYVLTGHGQKHLTEVLDDTEIVPGIMEAAEKIVTGYQIKRPKRSHKHMETEFILNLGVACDLWQRPDLGHEPEHAKQVAEVLQKVGIRVHKVSGGWLECEPRPVGIWEALTSRLAEPNWAKQFNCPPERSGQVLKLLSDKGIPVSDF
jgi:D-glycero-D-manno-heptose 1,7-bisphosphate phosphatase